MYLVCLSKLPILNDLRILQFHESICVACFKLPTTHRTNTSDLTHWWMSPEKIGESSPMFYFTNQYKLQHINCKLTLTERFIFHIAAESQLCKRSPLYWHDAFQSGQSTCHLCASVRHSFKLYRKVKLTCAITVLHLIWKQFFLLLVGSLHDSNYLATML